MKLTENLLKIKRNIYAKNTIPSCSNFEKKITFQKNHNKIDLMQNIIHFWCPVKWKKSEGMNCTEFSKKKNIFHTTPLTKYLPCSEVKVWTVLNLVKEEYIPHYYIKKILTMSYINIKQKKKKINVDIQSDDR